MSRTARPLFSELVQYLLLGKCSLRVLLSYYLSERFAAEKNYNFIIKNPSENVRFYSFDGNVDLKYIRGHIRSFNGGGSVTYYT